MGKRNRIVQPKTVRVEISDGDWLDIKKELNAGEEKEMFAQSIKQMGGEMDQDAKADDKVEMRIDMDPVGLSFAKVEAYLVAWSFEDDEVDDSGKPTGNRVAVELTPEAIRLIDEGSFQEIEKAIDKHREALDNRKKATGGKLKSAKT